MVWVDWPFAFVVRGTREDAAALHAIVPELGIDLTNAAAWPATERGALHDAPKTSCAPVGMAASGIASGSNWKAHRPLLVKPTCLNPALR